MSRNRSKPALSKNLLSMKFMKKTKEKLEIDEESETIKTYFNTVDKEDTFIVEPQYAICEELIFGRLAFHGMNTEIEKLTKDGKQKREKEKEVNNILQNAISDQEMAKRYSNLIQTVKKKFTRKRKRCSMTDAKFSSSKKKS